MLIAGKGTFTNEIPVYFKINNFMKIMLLGAALSAKIPVGILGAWEAPG